MFHLSYIPFLSVSIMHNFYADLVSEDFSFTVLPKTAAILEAYGLKQKNSGGKLLIYQQRDENGQPMQPVDQVLDLFFLATIKTDLLNITESFGKGKYWFSNLKENGSYQNFLTTTTVCGADDELSAVSGEQMQINFIPGRINKISVKKLKSGIGWIDHSSFIIDPKASSKLIEAPSPGLYRIDKKLTAGGTESTKMLLHDDLKNNSEFWSIIHLQVNPGDTDKHYSIELKSKESLWQFYIIEPEGRNGNTIDPNNLLIKFAASSASRYPVNANIDLIDPGSFPEPIKQYVKAIKSAGKIKEVYVFESGDKLEVLDGEQPQVKILYANQVLAEKISIPGRSMKSTAIIYKL